MIHMYECDGGDNGIFWDLYDSDYEFMRSIPSDKLEDVLSIYRAGGVDFVLHTLEYCDEYHLALEEL